MRSIYQNYGAICYFWLNWETDLDPTTIGIDAHTKLVGLIADYYTTAPVLKSKLNLKYEFVNFWHENLLLLIRKTCELKIIYYE